MVNPYDVGFDYEFYRYSVVIPDYFVDMQPDNGRNFRFRIKLIENNISLGFGDQMQPPPTPNPSDDEDNYYVSNVAVMFPNNTPDLEAQVIKVI
jgi:hypothetical protein